MNLKGTTLSEINEQFNINVLIMDSYIGSALKAAKLERPASFFESWSLVNQLVMRGECGTLKDWCAMMGINFKSPDVGRLMRTTETHEQIMGWVAQGIAKSEVDNGN